MARFDFRDHHFLHTGPSQKPSYVGRGDLENSYVPFRELVVWYILKEAKLRTIQLTSDQSELQLKLHISSAPTYKYAYIRQDTPEQHTVLACAKKWTSASSRAPIPSNGADARALSTESKTLANTDRSITIRFPFPLSLGRTLPPTLAKASISRCSCTTGCVVCGFAHQIFTIETKY